MPSEAYLISQVFRRRAGSASAPFLNATPGGHAATAAAAVGLRARGSEPPESGSGVAGAGSTLMT